jgi:hypothetical protein
VADPWGLSITIVAGHSEQTAGVCRVVQQTFAPEFGDEKWLEKGVQG